MDYNLKVKINGVEILEHQEELIEEGFAYTAPSISGAELTNGASTGTMDIGSSVSDALKFILLNPHKRSFDGDTVEFYVSPAESDELTTKERIENQIGSDASQDVISDDEYIFEIEETSEEGEDATEEDLADAAAVDSEINNAQDAFFEGTDEEIIDEETDGGEEAQWRKVGTYYAYSQSDVNGGVMLTCYDGFIKMHGDFVPKQKTATVQVMFDDLRSQVLEKCGIVIDSFEFPANANTTITWDFICSYRQALGYFAGIVGGFATFDQDGVANISFYTFSDNILIDSDLISFRETSTGEMLLDGIQCRCSVDGADGDLIEVGAGQSISFINPFMKEDMLGDIYSLYRGIRFEGATVATRWDDSLIAGEFVRIFTEDEYKAYIGISNSIKEASDGETIAELKADLNTLGKVILISSQVVNFTGDATTTIKSICGSETMKENQPDSDLIIKLKQANQKIEEAAKQATNYIKATIDGFIVGNITEEELRRNVLIDAEGVNIRDGDNILAVYGDDITLYSQGNEAFTIKKSTYITDMINSGRYYEAGAAADTENITVYFSEPPELKPIGTGTSWDPDTEINLEAGLPYLIEISLPDSGNGWAWTVRYLVFVPTTSERLDYFSWYEQTPETIDVNGTELPCFYADGNASIELDMNGSVWIHNTADNSGLLQGAPPFAIGSKSGLRMEFDCDEIMAKSDDNTPSGLHLNSDGGYVKINNNMARSIAFHGGNIYGKNDDFYGGILVNLIELLNANGNLVIGYGLYANGQGNTNIYGGNINLTSVGMTKVTGDLYAGSIPLHTIRRGNVAITPSAANTPTGKKVSWTSTGGSTFCIACPATTVPGSTVKGVGAAGTSSTGSTIYICRSNTTETRVDYMAIA